MVLKSRKWYILSFIEEINEKMGDLVNIVLRKKGEREMEKFEETD
jgi:hypothetical protein